MRSVKIIHRKIRDTYGQHSRPFQSTFKQIDKIFKRSGLAKYEITENPVVAIVHMTIFMFIVQVLWKIILFYTVGLFSFNNQWRCKKLLFVS